MNAESEAPFWQAEREQWWAWKNVPTHGLARPQRFLAPQTPQNTAPPAGRVHNIHFWFHCTARTFSSFFFFFQKKCFEGLRGSTIRLFRVPEIRVLDVLRPLKTHISRHLIQSPDSGSKKKELGLWTELNWFYRQKKNKMNFSISARSTHATYLPSASDLLNRATRSSTLREPDGRVVAPGITILIFWWKF